MARNKEDLIMKRAMQVFAKYAPAYFGYGGKVKEIGFTEDLSLILKDMRMDYVFLMDNDTYCHFEFQTTDKGIEDLIRFNAYDISLFQHTKRQVITYVIYSSNIKNPKSQYTFGNGNTYKVIPICMSNKDGVKILSHIENKLKNGQPLTGIEQMDLVFTPIMGGGLSKVDAVNKALSLTIDYEVENHDNIQAMLYTFATKFLNSQELEGIKERIKMTHLGKMIIEESYAYGHTEG
ncbi:MAG: hypothetical protein ATN36_02635 [Epulopiscium sp. Nele67-Bin005]|nr:MAG: hypothetical protein ATN36_02635 [Epulopiscium sp. Nele67-Bin005]